MALVYDDGGNLAGWDDDGQDEHDNAGYVREGSRERMEFLAEHPEWAIRYVSEFGYFEATRDEPNTIMTDYNLPALLRRAEAAAQ